MADCSRAKTVLRRCVLSVLVDSVAFGRRLFPPAFVLLLTSVFGMMLSDHAQGLADAAWSGVAALR